MKYSEIKNLEELDSALADVSAKISAEGGRMASRVEDAKAFYTPANIVAAGIRNASGVVPWDRLTLWLIRFLKGRMS